MAKPISLLESANAFARDYPRDKMPEGYMWDLMDYVPSLLDAQLTGRGPWKWASDVCPDDIEAGIFANFKKGPKLLATGAAGNLLDIDPTTGAVTILGAINRPRQNPVQHRDWVVIPDAAGMNVPKYVTWDGVSAPVIKNFHSSALKGRYATVYKDKTLLANAVDNEERIAFSTPGFLDINTPANSGKPDLVPWDTRSVVDTSLALTGIGALRGMILCFHDGSVERIRGNSPATEFDPEGDLFLEPLYDRAGCGDARSIAYWNDNCIFADERGVHFTDGAIVRNLASQGGILTLWRTAYRDRETIAADTYLDYYITTLIRTTGEALTLVCDLNRRSWFRLMNFRSMAYFHSIGAQEKLWGSRRGNKRLTEFSTCFFPTTVGPVIDDDGSPVLPIIETPWYRLSDEGRKRVRFVYTSYDARVGGTEVAQAWRAEPRGDGEHVLEELAQSMTNGAKAAIDQLLEVGYITSPKDTAYEIAGHLPSTEDYERYRLPVRKNPYGIAFRIRQLQASNVTRLYDIAAHAQADERGRL